MIAWGDCYCEEKPALFWQQELVKNCFMSTSRIEKSTPISLISPTPDIVYHMEFDRYIQGFVAYTAEHALMTGNGTTTHVIAGNSAQIGYKEGVGADARFNRVLSFAQISEKLVIVADLRNHCLRLIDRTTNNTSEFTGQCESRGYENGRPGLFAGPWSVVIDKRDKYQLFIVDRYNKAVRTVNVISRVVQTLVESNSFFAIRGITQEEKSGDLYVTADNAVYKIAYTQGTMKLISGSPGTSGYMDSTLLNSKFDFPGHLIFITPKTLLIADDDNDKLRLVHMNSDKVTTLNVTNSLDTPNSLLLTKNSLYVGQLGKIFQCMCEFYSIFLT